MSELDEAIREFLMEGQESLVQLEKLFLEAESLEPTPESLTAAFRLLHSLKGAAGFLNFPTLESVTHAAESLLAKLRSGELPFSPGIGDLLLRVIDTLREIFRAIADGNGDNPKPMETGELVRLLANPVAVATNNSGPTVVPARPVVPPQTQISAQYSVLSQQSLQGNDSVVLGRSGPAKNEKENSVRIDLELVDRLMTLAGEMVLARNRIIQQVGQFNHPALSAASRQLNQVTTELQEAVMKMRMYPISNLWSRLPRVVRDLAQQVGKKCRLEMEGGSTELDKNLIEVIKDPLTHLVRNAVDHGIEGPGERLKAGKSPEGLLTLRARHESGQVIIELQDDGKGMDPQSIRAKAVERGIATRDAVDRQSDQDVLSYVFLPGFSTARAVTQVSGRGIGMDVVKTNIENLGGSIDLDTIPGKGTTVRLRIPLTLAIVNALVVVSGHSHLALPQSGIVELLRLQGDRLGALVEESAGTRVLRFRGRLLPLLVLSDILGEKTGLMAGGEEQALSVVVLRGEDRIFALAVDRILDAQEIVVKPLPVPLRHLAIYGGATLLGDGRIALIMDIPGLADAGGVAVAGGGAVEFPEAHVSTEQVRPLLLVELTPGRLHGFLLDMVERLEEFETSRIETTARGPAVPYRGGLLPLVELSGLPGWEPASRERKIQPVVVHRLKAGLGGLMVNQILNTVEEPWTLVEGGASPGVTATALVRGRTVEIIDPAFWCDRGKSNG